MANPEDLRPLGSLDAAEIRARGILAELRMARHPLPQLTGAASSPEPDPVPSWTRERALAVLLPIAEGEAPDSARVAAVAELNRMFGLQQISPTEPAPWEGAL